MVMPCSCCPTDAQGCALVSLQFDTVAETVPQAGWNQVVLERTIDGVVATSLLSGYTTSVGNTPSAALRVTYGMATPQNRVRGIRIWNQAGSDHNDADGINRFTAEFYAGAVLLATETWQVGNGAAPFTRTLPNGLELNGVTSVVLRTIDKQIGGSAAPLWREFQLVEFQTVFPCRRPNGVLEWYDAAGNQVANADVINCQQPPQPWVPTQVVLTSSFFGDDPSGTGENLCNVTPAPTGTTGLNPVAGNCYDPIAGNPSMTWGPTSRIEMEYTGGPANQASGAAFINFTTTPGGLITWPASGVQMGIGEQIMSNLIPGGRRAILTYVSGPPQNSPSGTVRALGGGQIALHGLNVSVALPIRFRVDFVNA